MINYKEKYDLKSLYNNSHFNCIYGIAEAFGSKIFKPTDMGVEKIRKI